MTPRRFPVWRRTFSAMRKNACCRDVSADASMALACWAARTFDWRISSRVRDSSFCWMNRPTTSHRNANGAKKPSKKPPMVAAPSRQKVQPTPVAK